jgi:hypothetical protein
MTPIAAILFDRGDIFRGGEALWAGASIHCSNPSV